LDETLRNSGCRSIVWGNAMSKSCWNGVKEGMRSFGLSCYEAQIDSYTHFTMCVGYWVCSMA